MSELPDMNLTINAVITGTVDANGTVSASAQYSQGPSTPESFNVVDSDGNINLNNMAYDSSQYSTDTDITVNLSGQITDANGGSVSFSFPEVPNQAVTIAKEGGGGNSDISPVAGNSLMQLIIDDNDDDSATYSYCLSINVLTQPPTLVSLDPRIVNR